jgi:hypothetical protein
VALTQQTPEEVVSAQGYARSESAIVKQNAQKKATKPTNLRGSTPGGMEEQRENMIDVYNAGKAELDQRRQALAVDPHGRPLQGKYLADYMRNTEKTYQSDIDNLEQTVTKGFWNFVDAQHQSFMRSALDTMTKNYGNDAAYDDALAAGHSQIDRWLNAPEDKAVNEQAHEDWDDLFVTERYNLLYDNSKFEQASQFMESNPGRSDETRADRKANAIASANAAAAKTKADRIENIAQAVLQQYPPEKYKEGQQFIDGATNGQKNFDAMDIQGIQSRYTQLINHNKADTAAQAEARKQVQEENGQMLRKSFFQNYKPTPENVLHKAYEEGHINKSDYKEQLGYLDTFATREKATEFLQNRWGSKWGDFSPSEQDEMIMGAMNRTDAQHKAAFEDARTKVMEGRVTDDYVRREYGNGKITATERDKLLGMNATYSEYQKALIQDMDNKLKVDYSKVLNATLTEEDKSLLISDFHLRLAKAQLNPQSGTYTEDVQKIYDATVISNAIKEVGTDALTPQTYDGAWDVAKNIWTATSETPFFNREFTPEWQRIIDYSDNRARMEAHQAEFNNRKIPDPEDIDIARGAAQRPDGQTATPTNAAADASGKPQDTPEGKAPAKQGEFNPRIPPIITMPLPNSMASRDVAPIQGPPTSADALGKVLETPGNPRGVLSDDQMLTSGDVGRLIPPNVTSGDATPGNVVSDDVASNDATPKPEAPAPVPETPEETVQIDKMVNDRLEEVKKFGKRRDGTPKGAGHIGFVEKEVETKDGPKIETATELTIDVPAYLITGGEKKEGELIEVPTLVPGLSVEEVQTLANLKDDDPIPREIMNKVLDFHKDRYLNNQPFFATPEEEKAALRAQSKAWIDLEKKSTLEASQTAGQGNSPAAASATNAGASTPADSVTVMSPGSPQAQSEVSKIGRVIWSAASKYEGGNMKSLNKASSDGMSFGPLQLSSNGGGLVRYLKFLDKEAPQFKTALMAGVTWSGEGGGYDEQFVKNWNALVDGPDGAAFEEIYYAAGKTLYYDEARNTLLKATGIDADNNVAIAGSIMSAGIQHGPQGGLNKIIKQSGITKDMSPAEIVQRLFTARGVLHPKFKEQRYVNEVKDHLARVNDGPVGTAKLSGNYTKGNAQSIRDAGSSYSKWASDPETSYMDPHYGKYVFNKDQGGFFFNQDEKDIEWNEAYGGYYDSAGNKYDFDPETGMFSYTIDAEDDENDYADDLDDDGGSGEAEGEEGEGEGEGGGDEGGEGGGEGGGDGGGDEGGEGGGGGAPEIPGAKKPEFVIQGVSPSSGGTGGSIENLWGGGSPLLNDDMSGNPRFLEAQRLTAIMTNQSPLLMKVGMA